MNSIGNSSEADSLLKDFGQSVNDALKGIIKVDPNNKEGKNFICMLCRYKKSSRCVTFYCQNIIEHFKSRSHKQKLRTAQEQENLEELIKELEDYFLSQEIKNNCSDKLPLVEEQHKL